MPNGDRAHIFALVRAGAMAACRRTEAAVPNVHKAAPFETACPLPSTHMPRLSSRLWAAALCKQKEMHVGRLALQEAALRYESITSEAKKLGFDALQRGEMRRRSNLLPFSNRKQQQQQQQQSDDGGGGGDRDGVADQRRMLATIFEEEMGGCQAWTTVAAASFTLPLDVVTCRSLCLLWKRSKDADTRDTFTSEAGKYFAASDVDERISALLRALAVVSAMLNHFFPLRWAVAAAAFDAWEVALTAFGQLLCNRDVVSFSVAEALVPDILTVIPSNYLMQWCSALFAVYRAEMFSCIAPIQQILSECVGSVSTSSLCSWCNALRALSEVQLLEVKRHLQQELRDRLAFVSLSDRSSVKQAQSFKEACDVYRTELQSYQASRTHLRRQKGPHPSAALNDSASRRSKALGCRDHVDVAAQVDKVAEKTRPMVAPKANLSASRPQLAASCWESTVLEIWKARRETVLDVLRARCLRASDELKEAHLHPHGLGVEAAGGGMKSESESDSDLLEAFFSQLCAIVSPQHQDVAPLTHALWQWIRNASSAINEEAYVVLALELAAFFFAAKTHRVKGRDMLPELMSLSQRVRKGYEHGDTPCFLPWKLEESLSLFLVDAAMLVLLHQTGPFPFSATGRWKRDRRSLVCVAEFLFKFHSPRCLQRAVSTFRDDNKFHSQRSEDDAAALPSSNLPFHRQADEVIFLMTVSNCSGCWEVESLAPPLEPLFLMEVIEQLGRGVLSLLKKFPVRGKRPLPHFLLEALWSTLLPLAGWALHHHRFIQMKCGVGAVCRLVELSHTIVGDVALRWNYSVVPAKRRWKNKAMSLSTALVLKRGWGMTMGVLLEGEEEYEANETVADCVVKFASLLEGLLLSAWGTQSSLLPDSRSFSCMCNAVGVVLHDVDDRTCHQIMTHLLQLAPPDEEMDAEAHMAVLRCLASMRHGCTLWEEAVQHYRRAVLAAGDVVVGTSGSLRRQPHLTSDLATARVLRCVGSCPLPYALRCMLTLRIVAFARASGVPLNPISLSACVQNFTLRKGTTAVGVFGGLPWCDALGWYNDVVQHGDGAASLLPPHGLCFHVACLQGLLAQNEWRKALVFLELAGICSHHTHGMALALAVTGTGAARKRIDVSLGLCFLLLLCASDRTRSCSEAARSLLQAHLENASTPLGSGMVDEERLRRLCHTATAALPLHRDLSKRSRTPLFRHEAPLFAKPTADWEGEVALLRGACELSYNHPRYSHVALVAKLESRSSCLRLHELIEETPNGRGVSQRKQERQHQQEREQPQSPICVRGRVSSGFPRFRVLWSETTPLKGKENACDKTRMAVAATRSMVDTHYASAMVSLRRLERIRHEKRIGVHLRRCRRRGQQREASDHGDGEGRIVPNERNTA